MVSCEGDTAGVQYYIEDQGNYFAGQESCLTKEGMTVVHMGKLSRRIGLFDVMIVKSDKSLYTNCRRTIFGM